ncbi:hypothetical protein O181_013269 [Austropuccinia psidii MF-1]|uniref:Uncharacterized protein n=1 Tax=Austropuccinia psidii MF-1 TaxID=1389203 RepID=A0A9Q3BXW1_9BASI|nr:hypothetical protein [Austropuccinia psidii MF-1]
MSQSRAKAVLTQTPRARLYGTPEVPQLRAHYRRGRTIHPGRKRAQKIKLLFRSYGEEEEEKFVEEEDLDGTEDFPASVREFKGTQGPTISHYNKPVSDQSESSQLVIMQQMTNIITNSQEA